MDEDDIKTEAEKHGESPYQHVIEDDMDDNRSGIED